jgi:acetyl-CoA acetyltransferase
MAEDIFIVGVSMTRFGRMLDTGIKQLCNAAVTEALADAGLARSDIHAIYFGNCMQGLMEGQHCIRGQVVLREQGFERVQIINLENACATGSTAFAEAVKFVKAGEGEVALALGVEKLFSTDRAAMFAAFDSAWDVSATERNSEKLNSLGEGVEVPPESVSGKPFSRFMDVYAAFARFHMREYGLTQRQLAAVAAKNHDHSVHNERAQYREPYTIDEVLTARPISYPLTLPMCAPISDGAAAAVVCSRAALKRLGINPGRAVRVLASVVGSGINRSPKDYAADHISRLTANRAYERAAVGPVDIDVAEVHDATAVGEIIESECLGLAPTGEGGPIAEAGDTRLGGRIPINPSGGLESKGHPLAATGLGQIFELTAQLRNESGQRQVPGARIAIAQNGGGLWGYEEAVCAVTILAES